MIRSACSRMVLLVLVSAAGTASSAPPSFQGLGGLYADPITGQLESHASGVSARGTTAVGSSLDSTGRVRPYRWTNSGGMHALPDPAGGTAPAFYQTCGASGNGSVVAGTIWVDGSCTTAAKWVDSDAPAIQDLGACSSTAFGISHDGSMIVGDLYSGTSSFGFLWRPNGPTFLPLSPPPGYTDAAARGVSEGAAVIVGIATGRPGLQPIVWENQAQIARGLGYLPNSERYKVGNANAVSPDGQFVVGNSSSSAIVNGGLEGFVYPMPAGPMIGLGVPSGGRQTSPAAVCNRGLVIVGSAYEASPPFEQRAIIWTPDHGLRDLKSVLETDYSLNLTGWTLTEATGISANGGVIVGTGVSPIGTQAWVAEIPPAFETFCIADFNRDGGVDGSDVRDFYLAWVDAENAADANNDGGVDGADVETFFLVWEAGGCD